MKNGRLKNGRSNKHEKWENGKLKNGNSEKKKNKSGGTGQPNNSKPDNAAAIWKARTWPVSTATSTGNLLSSMDYNRAEQEYEILCGIQQ